MYIGIYFLDRNVCSYYNRDTILRGGFQMDSDKETIKRFIQNATIEQLEELILYVKNFGKYPELVNLLNEKIDIMAKSLK